MKGITPFTNAIPPDVLNSRLCMGFLQKKRKKLSTFLKQWFILISSQSFVRGEQSEKFSEVLLKDDQLPPWMELDTIYYFKCKSNDDKSPFVGKIPLRNFISISIETQLSDDSHGGYYFKLVTKERTYVFCAKLIIEMNKWITAIEGSIKNYLTSRHQSNEVIMHNVSIKDDSFGTKSVLLEEENNEGKKSKKKSKY